MLPNTKRHQKSHQNDVVRLEPSISMPSLTSKPQIPLTKPFDIRHSSWHLKQKTAAETIRETKRMLSNGAYLFLYFPKKKEFKLIKKINHKQITHKTKQKNKQFPRFVTS